MSEQAMATYTINPVFNFNTGKLEFLNQKNRPVTFTMLPLSLDMRQGKRDYDYLMEPLLSPNSPGSIEIVYPFITFPKGFLGTARPSLNGWQGDQVYADSYTTIQGNTRLMLLMDVVSHIESIWETINAGSESFDEKVAKFNAGIDRATELAQSENESLQDLYDCVRNVKPFSITVLSEDRASDWSFVMWLQRSGNDAVKTQGILQNAKAAIAFYNFLTEENNAKPKKEQSKNKDLIARAMAPFGLQVTRFYHYQQVFSSPDWLQSALDDGMMSLDTVVDFLNTFNRITKAYEAKGKTLLTKLEHFFDNVRDAAQADRKQDQALKIFTSHVLKAEKVLMDAINPEEPTVNPPEPGTGEGGTGEGGTGEGGTGEGGTGDGNAPKLTADQYAAEIQKILDSSFLDNLLALQSGDTSILIANEDGTAAPRYNEATLKKIYKGLTSLYELLATGEDGAYVHLVTLAQEAAMAEMKRKQKEDKKASQTLNVPSESPEVPPADTVAANGEALIDDLIPVG